MNITTIVYKHKVQYKDNNSALTWHKIRYTYSARIGENAREIFPDSKPHPYIDFMSSQCTVIVFILQSLVTLMEIFILLPIFKLFKPKMTLNNETPARFNLTTDVENINRRINFLKYYNKKLIDPSKFVPKCWFVF
jgi:hypothetical protein